MAAAVLIDDNDSDYGWDLSPEDEEQIHALIARASPPVLLSTAPRSIITSSSSRRAGLSVGDILARNDSCPPEAAATVLFRERSGGGGGGVDLASLDPSYSYDDTGSVPSRPSRDDDGRTPGVVFPGPSSPHLVSIPADDDNIGYPSLKNALSNTSPSSESVPRQPDLERDLDALSRSKSPLARFRTYPKKPFSVTELASGAWCELQYEFTLNLRGGRKKRTAAMKSGSRIHQSLEYEVHPPVKIDVLTKEDAFGLRIWNIIQGLRTLREDGLTREMEVWGLVNGHLVNGVIDVLSYEHPDPNPDPGEEEGEGAMSAEPAVADTAGQPRITEFFPSPSKEELKAPAPKICITDVKTRGSKTVPVKPSLLRPTKVQLFLYHRFLSEMASDKLDFLLVIRRYGLDPDAIFSDAFIAQMGGMHNEIFFDAASSPTPATASLAEPPTSTQPGPDLIRYKTIRSLIPLLREELLLTFPEGADSLGCEVKVEYRYRPWGDANGDDEGDATGQVIGGNTISVDDESLQSFLDHYMKWWNGERPAEGVDIEDAMIKCRNCDYAEMCEWRQEQDKERLEKAREKLALKPDEMPTEKMAPRRSPRSKGKTVVKE